MQTLPCFLITTLTFTKLARMSPSMNPKTTSFDDLPTEMAVNILLRLPVKPLIRSTSVNKKWYSLITSPNFISTQIKRAISHCHDNAVLIVPPIISRQNYCSLVDAHTGSVIENFRIPFKTKTNSLKFSSSINGLMLLTDLHVHYACRDLYLWNPCIKKHMTLVSTCFKKIIGDHKNWYVIAGLGFNKDRNDFRVVRILCYKNKGERFRGVVPRAEIYSLKDCTWRKLKDHRVPRVCSEYGSFVDGSYYWLRGKLESESEGVIEMWIVSFDFDKEVFGELRLPVEVSYCLGESGRFRLMGFEGSLAVCVTRIDNSNGVASSPHCIWLMSHDKGVISWTLRFRAVMEKVGWPMNITKSGTLILETYPLRMLEVTKIVSCNLNTQQYKDLGFCKLGVSDGSSEDSRFLYAPCVVYTSFLESLAMFEGGKSLLKPSEQS